MTRVWAVGAGEGQDVYISASNGREAALAWLSQARPVTFARVRTYPTDDALEVSWWELSCRLLSEKHR